MTNAATAIPNDIRALCFCLLATFTLLSGCSGPSPILHSENISQARKPSIPSSKERCLVHDNLWVRQGLSGSESCRVKTADSQKVCTDSAQCEGLCLADVTAPHNLSVLLEHALLGLTSLVVTRLLRRVLCGKFALTEHCKQIEWDSQ
jgi:hypothetical protein